MQQSIKKVIGEAYYQEINDFLMPEECHWLIAMSERKGFESVQRNKQGDLINNIAIRSDDHVSIRNETWASNLELRLKSILPDSINGMKFPKILPNLKFNKYSVGQDFKPHNDSCLIKSKQQSKLTLMIYLNENCKGGNTRFFDIESMNYFDIVPETGKAVIIDQNLYHAGLKVSSGVKYTLRLDIMYGKEKRLSNVFKRIKSSGYRSMKRRPGIKRD